MKTLFIKHKLFFTLTIGAFVLGSACTDLSETLYSEVSDKNFYNNPQEVESAVLRPYTHARAWDAISGQIGCWTLNEYSGDQLAWPVKGIHGYDGGLWIRLHYHSWLAEDFSARRPWELLYSGIGYCNDAIETLKKKDLATMGIDENERTKHIAELRAFRAFHYLKLIDLYGNVPLVTILGEPESPANAPRSKVYDFIESELLAVIADLPVLNKTNIGRFSRAAAYAALSSLYLNAEVYSGTPQWDKCIAACNTILAGEVGGQLGTAALDGSLLTPFQNTNTTSSQENLFVFTYDYQKSPNRCLWSGDLYHFNQRYIYGGDLDGNDGGVVIPTAFDAFSDSDLRKSTWLLYGPQYRYDNPSQPVTGAYEYAGQPLVFVREIQRNSEGKTESTMYDGEENSGARFNKYRPGATSDPNFWSNDWVVYRLTEIYFNKAEAIMRKNGGATQEAVDLINACRIRAFNATDWNANKYTTTSLTLDELLAERGREFIFEGKRRTDLVRFDKFSKGSWWDHTATMNSNKNLFPIPTEQLNVNKNLIQNPGY